MQMFQKKWLTRMMFLLVALALVVSFTAVAQADEPPADKPPMGKPPMGEMAKPMMKGDCIKGTVWYDGNHNGKLDDNEDPMDGAEVHLLVLVPPLMGKPPMGKPPMGKPPMGPPPMGPPKEDMPKMEMPVMPKLTYQTIAVQTTSGGGHYEFCGLPPGKYILKVEPAEGHLKDDLVLTKGYNPTKPIMVGAVVNFGFSTPHILDSDDSLNTPDGTNLGKEADEPDDSDEDEEETGLG